jgi:signal transduction histidine kinase
MTAREPDDATSIRAIEPAEEASGGLAQASMLRRLEAQCAVTQTLGRNRQGQWKALHRGGRAAAAQPIDDAVADGPARDVAQLLAWIAAADRPIVGAAIEYVLASGADWRGHAGLAGAEAATLPLEVEIHPEVADGEWVICTLIGREPGPRGQTAPSAINGYRERVSVVQAAVELGFIEFDADTRIVHLDEAAAALHGIASTTAVAMPLEDWASLIVDADQLRAHAFLQSAIPPGETERLTVRIADADPKKPRLLALALRALPQTNRRVGACRDVTRERSLEALRRQKLSAERASAAKSEFMSHVSHELRTPLNAILGFAQLMEMDPENPLPSEHRQRLEMVQHSGRRLLGLIDQLLQITKIERGTKRLKAKPVNVHALVRRCVEALDLMALERDIRIVIDVERPDSSAVRADPVALEQVVLNLLSNAIKYNRDHGRVRIVYRAGEVGELVVDDTGKGMSESQLGRMFEPFDRLDAEATAVPGTGLGLVITKQLVEAMGGKLDVASQLGRGSMFKVELPMAADSVDDSNTAQLNLPSQWDTGREYVVLYIEDDEVNVVLMEQLFATQPEWRLHCASSGAEGIAAAVRHQPKVILLDMNLPDMPGVDVFKRLQAHRSTRDIPCVAVSADAMPKQIALVESLGFEDYWTKPLDLPATIAKLKQLLV